MTSLPGILSARRSHGPIGQRLPDNVSGDALPQAVATVRHGELALYVRPPPQWAREILRDCLEVGPSRPSQRD